MSEDRSAFSRSEFIRASQFEGGIETQPRDGHSRHQGQNATMTETDIPTDRIEQLIAEGSADDWEAFLLKHDRLSLLYVGEDEWVHELEEDEGRLRLWIQGGEGRDVEDAREALRSVVDTETHMKVVPKERQFAERRKLIDGEYDSPEEWAESGVGA